MDQVQSFAQAYSQAPWRKQLQVIGLFLLVLVLCSLVAGIYLSVTARAAAVGRDIQALQSDIEDLEQINADLQAQLAHVSSAQEMERRAQALGFRPIGMDEQVYVLAPGYQERRPMTLAPAPQPVIVGDSSLPHEYTESLFEWLNRQILAHPEILEALP